MALEIVASWQSLFRYAGEEGIAKREYSMRPTEENRKAMEDAIKAHKEYRDICLEADKMVGINFGKLY